MGRIRRIGYSFIVTVLVFSLLSVPILSRLYGPVVYLPVYALLSLVAGVATWSILRWIESPTDRSADIDVSGPVETDVHANESASVDVDAEIKSLRNDES